MDNIRGATWSRTETETFTAWPPLAASLVRPNGCGLVFRLSKVSGVWKETVLHKFTGGNDGYFPNSLVLDSAGNVYGTTMNGGGRGGPCNQGTDCGVVFQWTPVTTGTWPEKILYRFGGGNGVGPDALAFDSHGNLYGTTRNGAAAAPLARRPAVAACSSS